MNAPIEAAIVICSVLTVLTRADPALASDPEPAGHTLLATMVRAARTSPELGPNLAGERAAAATRRAIPTALSRPPQLELSVGPRRSASGDHGVDATVGLWQAVPLAALEENRRAVSRAGVRAARSATAAARHDIALTAGLAWVECARARELLELRKRSLRSAERLARLTQRRVRVGAEDEAEQARADVLVGQARAAVVEARGQRVAAEIQLNYLLGEHDTRAVASTGGLRDPLPPPPPAQSAREAHPRVKLARDRARRAELEIGRVRAAQSPTLSMGPSVTREATGDWIVLARINVPLPVVDTARFAVARQKESAARARATASLEQRRLRAERELAEHERRHARETRDALERDAIAPARRAAAAEAARYRSGKGSFDSVARAHRALLEARERWVDAAADAVRAELRWRHASGRLLPKEYR